MLLGQRVDKLGKVFASDPKIAKAIEEFRALVSRRNSIVHGDGTVFIDAQGRWLVRLTYIAGNTAFQETILEEEADKLLREIQQCVQRLGSRL